MNTTTSRRTFLKASAVTALGCTLGGLLPSLVSASESTALAPSTSKLNHFKYGSATLQSLPSTLDMARQSEMVKAAYNVIIDYVLKIENGPLQKTVLGMIKDPQPTLAEAYKSPAAVQMLYTKLANAGYIKADSVPLDKLVPPYHGKAPQEFFTAPGSGYHSHHAYPGGLATHVAANMEITYSIINTYKHIYGYDPGHDAALAGQALHDITKPWVFQWQKDGTSLKEYSIAGTGSHHIYSISEVMVRGLPAEEVVAQACAHDNPGSEKSEASVVDWLKAAAIIADKDPIAYGVLTRDGLHIPTPHKQAGYIVHLGDHDWVLSSPASSRAEEALQSIAQNNYGINPKTDQFNHFRNFVCSQVSSMKIHDLLSQDRGTQQLASLVATLVRK